MQSTRQGDLTSGSAEFGHELQTVNPAQLHRLGVLRRNCRRGQPSHERRDVGGTRQHGLIPSGSVVGASTRVAALSRERNFGMTSDANKRRLPSTSS